MCRNVQATHVGTWQSEYFRFPREGANIALLAITHSVAQTAERLYEWTVRHIRTPGRLRWMSALVSCALSSKRANVKLTLKICVFKHVNQSKTCRNATKYQRRMRLYKCSLRVSFFMQTGFFFPPPSRSFTEPRSWWFIALISHSLRDITSLTFPIHPRAALFIELKNA